MDFPFGVFIIYTCLIIGKITTEKNNVVHNAYNAQFEILYLTMLILQFYLPKIIY